MRRIVFCFILIISFSSGFAQKGSELVDVLIEDGEFYLDDHQYEKAYFCWNKLMSVDKKNELFYKLKKGIAATHIPSKKQEAITLLEEIRSVDSTHHSILFNLGEAYHNNYDFDKAIFYLDKFIKNFPNSKEIKDAEMYLMQATNAKTVTKTTVNAEIKNIGSPVNTEDAEYVPLISADESVLIFTYRGKKSTGGLMDQDFKKDPDGEYYEDIYISKKVGENWEEPNSISPIINTKHNDACLALSADGQDLYTFYSTDKDGGDIYVCHLKGEVWSAPEKLGKNINTKYWEGSCSISSDGKHFYFASERPGGLGGKDIYLSEMQKDGSWGPAKNLGPNINTKYDDDSPFIHPDGITLFFSSEGHNSIGGYDIMFSIKKDNDWVEAINAGYPLNTTDDDICYVITAKGDKGYFSSTRTGYGEKGNQDIYQVTPGVVGEKPVLAMVKGIVYGNDVPIEAEIKITKKSNNELIGPFHSNKTTGKYLVALSPGESYNVQIDAPTYPKYEEELDIENLTKFVELVKEFHLEKDGYKDPHADTIKKFKEMLNDILDTITNVAYLKDSLIDAILNRDSIGKTITKVEKDSLINVVVTKRDTVKKDTVSIVQVNTDPCADFKTLNFSELKRKSLNDPAVYKKLLEIGTKICAKGMVFKVQIAAYRKPENYAWSHLKEFGEPAKVKLDDGITRFTQGEYLNIQDAEALRQKVIGKGQTDAWITGFIDGKRYTLEELIMVDFYNKNISSYEALRKELEEFMAGR